MTVQTNDPTLFYVGDTIHHVHLGQGVITAIGGPPNALQADVDFGARGVKRLILRYAPITLITEGPRHGEGEGATAADGTRAAVAEKVYELRVLRDAKRIVATEERPPVRQPEILTLRERLAQPREPIQYRISSWQPSGSRVMLAAQFKAGKTTVVGNLIRSLVDGDPFLDSYEVIQVAGTVVALDFEMSTHQLDDWLADQKIINDDKVTVIPLRGNGSAFDILDPAIRSQWAEMLKNRRCDYLIVDCLRPILDALGLDEHREAGRFLTTLDALLAEADVPEALVVHHMGHTGERSRGDSRIRDWPDVEWRLVREEDDPASPRYVSAYGRDVDVPESLVAFDSVTRRLSIAGGSRKDAAARAALADVLALLDDKPGLSLRAIEREAPGEHTRTAIRNAVKAGIADSLIVTKDGPRNSKLHECASAPSAPPVRRRSVSECASALIDGALTAQTTEGVSAPSDPDPPEEKEAHKDMTPPTLTGDLQPCKKCGKPTANADRLHITCR